MLRSGRPAPHMVSAHLRLILLMSLFLLAPAFFTLAPDARATGTEAPPSAESATSCAVATPADIRATSGAVVAPADIPAAPSVTSPATGATAPQQGAPPLHDAEASFSVPFGGGVSRETAEAIARAGARMALYRNAALMLDNNSVALFAAESPMRRIALAASCLEAAPASITVMGYPPEVRVVAAQTARTLPSGVDAALRTSLRNMEQLILREQTLQATEAALCEAVEYANNAARARQSQGLDTATHYDAHLALLGRRLHALAIVESVLPLFDGIWQRPQKVAARMHEAIELAPGIGLIRGIRGEALLQLDRPQDAIAECNAALGMDAANYRARYTRGVANLRLQFPALAVDDFTAVLRQRPDMAAAWRARGAAHHVREDYEHMCPDFHKACSLGDCDGLIQARERDLCLAEDASAAKLPPPATLRETP